MSLEKCPRTRVAVIGSGLAGLTIAYLLHQDPQQRYEVTVLESGERVSLDSASIDIDPGFNGGNRGRVDVPMRAFTGGYYRNLVAMYDHLGVQYRWQRFRFEFWGDRCQDADAASPYFVHASDNHEFPPPRPAGNGIVTYILKVIFVILCFFWFMACCHIIRPGPNESFDTYLRRIWMPRRFVSRYLLPLMSAVATCSHQEMLDFPASDVVLYRKLITRRKQYIVSGGVGRVQQILTKDSDVRLNMRVLRIETDSFGVRLELESIQDDGQRIQETAIYDRVIAAVPPNVVAAIFEPARSQLARIPVRNLETVVHRVPTDVRSPMSAHGADRIVLKTSNVGGGWTEATHLRQDGIAVTSCAISPIPREHNVLARTTFTRTLRTPGSRQVVKQIFGIDDPRTREASTEKYWRSGEQGVWVVGAWCFDGMVLLEGAVASAMHVAEAFGVEIPWKVVAMTKR